MVTGAEDLPLALAVLRVVRGWTQQELADASGIRACSLSDYERGKKIPELVTLRKILGAMGYPLATVEEAQNFVYRVRAGNKEIGIEPIGAEEAEVSIPELGMGASAVVRWEIEQVAAAGGRLVRRLLRLLLLLVARLWATRDAGPKDPSSEVDMREIHAILAQLASGDRDVAASHNENPP